MARNQKSLPLLFSNRSDVGRVRQVNEDYFGTFRSGDRQVFVVCDGMGGEAGGREASTTAVAAAQAVMERGASLRPLDIVRNSVEEAIQACDGRLAAQPELKGMGTTMDVLLVEGDRAWWAHIGDSRIYHIRDGKVTQLTKDHTLVQRMVDDGLLSAEDALEHPQRHVLNRVVGPGRTEPPDLSLVPLRLEKGDALVMCTDGLYDKVSASEIEWVVTRFGPERGCKRLIKLANERGGHDNITVQIVFFGQPRLSWQKMKSYARMPIQTTRPRPKRSRRVVYLGIAACLIVAVAGFFGVRYLLPKPESFTIKDTVALASLTATGSRFENVTISKEMEEILILKTVQEPMPATISKANAKANAKKSAKVDPKGSLKTRVRVDTLKVQRPFAKVVLSQPETSDQLAIVFKAHLPEGEPNKEIHVLRMRRYKTAAEDGEEMRIVSLRGEQLFVSGKGLAPDSIKLERIPDYFGLCVGKSGTVLLFKCGKTGKTRELKLEEAAKSQTLAWRKFNLDILPGGALAPADSAAAKGPVLELLRAKVFSSMKRDAFEKVFSAAVNLNDR
jgi:PPM family protein phosphatase